MLSWYQTEMGLYGVGVGEAPHIVECGNEPHGGHRSNPWNGHEKRADWMLPSDVLELLVRSCDAVVEHFDDHKQTSGGVRAVGPTKPPTLQNATHHARWVLAMIADCRQSRSPMDPQVCSIRRFRAEEWAAYRNLRLRSLIDAPDAFGSTLERESAWPERHWADRVSTAADSQTRLLLVAEIGMDPLGLVSGFIDPAEPEIAHVFQMWVAPHARGCGCGSMLLQT